jgi:hypothetical protein
VSESAFEPVSKTTPARVAAPISVQSDPAAVAFLRQNQAVAATVDADTIYVLPESANSRAVLSHEMAHILQLRSGRSASRDAAERAAGEYARGVRNDPGGAPIPPLFNDDKDARKGLPHADFFDDDSEIVFNEEDFSIPAVTKSGGRRYIEGRRVPNKSANTPKPTTRRLDAEDIVRRTDETRAQAVSRVQSVLGRRISETPFAPVWNAVVTRLTRGVTPSALGRERVLSIYARAQGMFWETVAQDPALVRILREAGIDFEPGHVAPLVAVNDPAAIPWYERKLNLDHLREKAIADNWLHALDADNLAFEAQGSNQYREAKQARLPELRPQANPSAGQPAASATPTAGVPDPGNLVEDPRATANIIVSQPWVLLRGNRAVEAVIRGDLTMITGPAGSLAEQRARRRTGVWREVALPEIDPSEVKDVVLRLPAQPGFAPFLPISGPPENEFVLSGDKYGVTIGHPSSETFVRVVEEQDRYGPNLISYPPKLETEEELFGRTETPAIAYEFVAAQDGKPGEVRIVVGPGAYVEINEPAPWEGAKEWQLEFRGTHLGGTFDLTIVEMPDNNLVPLPGERIDAGKLLAAGGKIREPDKHVWRGAISREDEEIFWIQLVGTIALALVPFGFELLEAVSLAEVVAATPEAVDISALTIGEVPVPGAAGFAAPEEAAAEGAFFEPGPGIDVTPPAEGEPPQSASVGRYGVDVHEKPSWAPTEEEAEQEAAQQQHVYVKW